MFYNRDDFYNLLEYGEYIETESKSIEVNENPNQISMFDEEDI